MGVMVVGGRGRIATVTDGNNKQRTLSYDNLDRITKITYADASYVQFVYDKDGNQTARNDTVGGNSTYTYDELSRVTGIRAVPAMSTRWTRRATARHGRSRAAT